MDYPYLKNMRIEDIKAEDPRDYDDGEWTDEHRDEYENLGGPEGYIELLADEISQDGLLKPLHVYACGQLKDGHHRLHAVKELGWTEVPVYVHRDTFGEHVAKMIKKVRRSEYANTRKQMKEVGE